MYEASADPLGATCFIQYWRIVIPCRLQCELKLDTKCVSTLWVTILYPVSVRIRAEPVIFGLPGMGMATLLRLNSVYA